MFGVTGETIRYRMANLGIPRRGRPWSSKEARAQLTCDYLKERYLERGLSMADIARELGVAEATVHAHLKQCGIERRDISSARVHYPRQDFSGDLLEMAYLLGFRQGDLWVAMANPGPHSTSIAVACATSRPEQVELFEALFTPYGHVAVTRGRKGPIVQYSLQCCLNMSFAFLLPKSDDIPDWIRSHDRAFAAFLAGYIDAEGSFQIGRGGTSRFYLGSYDVHILHQVHQVLAERFAINCPPPRLVTPKGSVISGGYRTNNDLWAVMTGRKSALYRLCQLLDPFVRHSKRRKDMEAVWRSVVAKGVDEADLNE